jgi:hypothetical protein
MKKPAIFGILSLIIIVLALFLMLGSKKAATPLITPSPSPSVSIPASTSQSISDGTITLNYSEKDFGLAVNQTQVPVKSYIPSCDPNFDYCFYFLPDTYKDTNFESAGLRVKKRTDLGNERVCLNTPKEGFDATIKPDKTRSENEFSSSVFGNVGDAAAGHYSEGKLYRLFVRSNSSCYEFETRIGQSRFENYPAGTITEFTASEKADVENNLNTVIIGISLAGKSNLFPKK